MLREQGPSHWEGPGKTHPAGGPAAAGSDLGVPRSPGRGLGATRRIDEVLRTAIRDKVRDTGTTPDRTRPNAFDCGVFQSLSLPLSCDPYPRRYRFLRTNQDRKPKNGQHRATVRLDRGRQVAEPTRLTRLRTRMSAREAARAVPTSRISGSSPAWWCRHDITADGSSGYSSGRAGDLQSGGRGPVARSRARPDLRCRQQLYQLKRISMGRARAVLSRASPTPAER